MYRVLKKLLSVLEAKQRKTTIILLFLMIVGALLESLSVSLVLPLITAVMDSHTWNTSWYSKLICGMFGISSQRIYAQTLIVLLIVVFVIKDIYIICEYYVQFTFISKSRLQMQRKLMESYIQKPYTFYLHISTGEVIRIITVDTEQTFILLTDVLTFLTEGIVSLLLGITVFIMSPALAIGLLSILLIEILLIARVIKPFMKYIGMQRREAMASTNKWILQAINGIKSIKVSQTEKFFDSMYTRNAKIVVNADRKQQTLGNVPRLMIESITVAAVLGMVLVQIIMGKDLADILPQLSAFVVAAIRLLPSVNRISTSMNQIPFLEGGLDNVIRAMSSNDEQIGDSENEVASAIAVTSSHTRKEINFDKKLCMKEVCFSYPDGEKKILDSANIEILSGQSVGIVGPSGEGKTTVIDVLLGLLKPQKGTVFVDGHDIEENLQSWLKNVAYIPQKIFLTDSTIRENVAFGIDYEKIDDSNVWEALREAQMEDFVRALPAGLDTIVGEQGIRLSGGQCQRIGIARALYRNPEILFFDEATSALDNETEAAVMASIEHLKGRRTLVIVAHRLTTIENCDVVYRVDKGKILKEK